MDYHNPEYESQKSNDHHVEKENIEVIQSPNLKSKNKFQEIISRMENSIQKEYKELHDPMMKKFCSADTKFEVKTEQIDVPPEIEKDLKQGFNRFESIITSLNGKYAAVVTTGGRILLVNLKPESNEQQLVILPEIDAKEVEVEEHDANKDDKKKNQKDKKKNKKGNKNNDDNILGVNGINIDMADDRNYNKGRYGVGLDEFTDFQDDMDEGAGVMDNRNRVSAPKPKVSTNTNLDLNTKYHLVHMCFSSDSEILVVSSSQQTKYFVCNQVIIKNFKDGDGMGTIEHKTGEAYGKLHFMYFHVPSFGNDRYIPLDKIILVMGFEKQLKLITFQKDNCTGVNFIRLTKKLLYLEITLLSYLRMMSYPDIRNGKAKIFFNGSGYIYFHRMEGKHDFIMGYKIDIDNPNEDSRFLHKFEYKIKKSAVLYPKSLSASGEYLFAYDSKRAEIQKLVLDKSKPETLLKLTGKRVNFKHLAVKDDGKYLLIVDSDSNAEVLMETNNTYTVIATFNIAKVGISNNASDDVYGNDQNEHDLTDMDFLEDGSGIINKKAGMVLLWYLRLPNTNYNYSIFLRQHFFDANMMETKDGKYTLWYNLLGESYQKTIDFNPPKEGGCIVRTNSLQWFSLPEDLFMAPPLYNGEVVFRNLMAQGYGSYSDQKKQLENFLKTPAEHILFFPMPESDKLICYFVINNELVSVRKQYTKRPDGENKKVEWDEYAEWRIELPEKPDLTVDRWRDHSAFFVDPNGKYIIVPIKKSGKQVGRVYRVLDGKEVCDIPEGDLFFVHDNNRVVVATRVKEEPIPEIAQNEEVKPPKKAGITLRVFELPEVSQIHESLGFRTAVLEVDCTIEKVRYLCQAGRNKDRKDKAVLLCGTSLLVIDLTDMTILGRDDDMIEKDEDIPLSDIFQTHCVLVSPSSQYLAISSLNDCDRIKVYDLFAPIADRIPPELNPNDKGILRINVMKEHSIKNWTIQMKTRADRLNRWCFTHDSQFLLIKAVDSIQIFSAYNFSKPISSVPLEEYISKHCKLMSIHLRKDSTELELALGYKNYIFFKRMPFYPTEADLMLPILKSKLNEYINVSDSKTQSQIANNIALIMAYQHRYQRSIDTTYLKILCMCDSNKVLSSYFSYSKLSTDLILEDGSFAKLVYMTMTDKNNKSKTIQYMHKNSANCFIDLMEEYETTEKHFPDVDRDILDSWLQSEELETEYKRKLVKIITFEPIPTDIKGQLYDDFKMVAKINSEKLEKNGDWLTEAKDELIDKQSANESKFTCFKTGIKFDFSNGSEFSLSYFRWLTEANDDDLVKSYKAIIYYKWNKIFAAAAVYSCLFWCLNVLYVAFMGFAFDNLALGITIGVINIFFLLYEIKCLSFNFKDSYKDLWNYYDLLIHGFSIYSLFYVYGRRSQDPYQYSWFRCISFVLISLRSFTMLRIFRQTRYLIIMLLEVFYDMFSFLGVYVYLIFIFWFVCIVRTNLILDGQDTDWYSSIQQALNIAFSNYSAADGSVITLVTDIFGQVVLALVLLNYLIAIVTTTYQRIAGERDLHDIKMVLDIIRELDCFFSLKRKFNIKNSEHYLLIIPASKSSSTLQEVREAFENLRTDTKEAMEKAFVSQKNKVEDAMETVMKELVQPLAKQVDTLKSNTGKMKKVILNEMAIYAKDRKELSKLKESDLNNTRRMEDIQSELRRIKTTSLDDNKIDEASGFMKMYFKKLGKTDAEIEKEIQRFKSIVTEEVESENQRLKEIEDGISTLNDSKLNMSKMSGDSDNEASEEKYDDQSEDKGSVAQSEKSILLEEEKEEEAGEEEGDGGQE